MMVGEAVNSGLPQAMTGVSHVLKAERIHSRKVNNSNLLLERQK